MLNDHGVGGVTLFRTHHVAGTKLFQRLSTRILVGQAIPQTPNFLISAIVVHPRLPQLPKLLVYQPSGSFHSHKLTICSLL